MGNKRAFRSLAGIAGSNRLRCLLYRLGGVNVGEGVWVGRGARVGVGATIGRNTRILSGAVISDGAEIGREVEIRNSATIGPSVIVGDAALVGGNCGLFSCTVGAGSFVDEGVLFVGSGDGLICIGEHCYIGIRAVLDRSGGIEIGDYVHIAGPAVSIWTHTSVYQCLASEKLDESVRRVIAPVRIESNVWIGGHSTIYPGVTVGHHTVILPNTVVNRSIGPLSVVGGVPAKLKRGIELSGREARFVQGQATERG